MKWEVFTAEEKTYIEKLTASGEFNSIAQCIAIDSPEKEYWLDQYMLDLKPVPVEIDSKVRKDITGVNIDSPEKEKEWQGKIDAEKEETKKKVLSAKEKRAADKKAKEEAEAAKEVARLSKSVTDTEAQLAVEAEARAKAEEKEKKEAARKELEASLTKKK